MPRFYFVSEQTELRSSVNAERANLEGREAELAKATRLAWHFAQEDFPGWGQPTGPRRVGSFPSRRSNLPRNASRAASPAGSAVGTPSLAS